MDYRPAHEGDDGDDGIVKVAPGRFSAPGVRSGLGATQTGSLDHTRSGLIQLDERRLTVVATRSPAFIEKVADVTTGDQIKKRQSASASIFAGASLDVAALYVSVAIPGGHSCGLTAAARRRLRNPRGSRGIPRGGCAHS